MPGLVSNFLNNPANLQKMSEAYLKTIAMDGAVLCILGNSTLSLEQMSRALGSYVARSFDSSFLVASLAGLWKYGMSPKASLLFQEYNVTANKLDPLEKNNYFFAHLPVELLATLGAMNHITYQAVDTFNIPVGNIYLFIGTLEALDSALQNIVKNANATQIIHGIKTNNYTEVLEGYNNGAEITIANPTENIITGIVSAISYGGIYEVLKQYLDAAFKPELFSEMTFSTVAKDIATISISAEIIYLLSDHFINYIAQDITYSDYDFINYQEENFCGSCSEDIKSEL